MRMRIEAFVAPALPDSNGTPNTVALAYAGLYDQALRRLCEK